MKSIYDFLNETNDKFLSENEKNENSDSIEHKAHHTRTKTKLDEIQKKFSSLFQNVSSLTTPTKDFDGRENEIFNETPTSPLNGKLSTGNNGNNGFISAVESIFKSLVDSNHETLKKLEDTTKEMRSLKEELLTQRNLNEKVSKSNAEKDNYIKMMEKQVFEKIEQISKDGETLSRLKIKSNEMASAMKMMAVEKGELENLLLKCHKKAKNGILLFKKFTSPEDDHDNVSVLANTFDCFENIRKLCEEKIKSDILSTSMSMEILDGSNKKKKEELDMNNPLERAQIDLLLVKREIDSNDIESNNDSEKSNKHYVETQKIKISNKLKELFNSISGTKKQIDDLNAQIISLKKKNNFMEDQVVRARIKIKSLKLQISSICKNVGKYINDSQNVSSSLNKENIALQSELLRFKRVGKYSTLPRKMNMKKLKKMYTSNENPNGKEKKVRKRAMSSKRKKSSTLRKSETNYVRKYGIAQALQKFHQNSPKKKD